MTKPQILLADENTLLAEGIKKLLEHEVDCVGIVGDGRALLRAVEQHRPDLVFMDISLPLLNGLDAARQIRKTHPSVKIIVLTMHSEPQFVSEAFRIGISGYLVKQAVTEELIFAMKEVLKGRTYVSPYVAGVLVEQLLHPSDHVNAADDGIAPLSSRQREVLQLVAEGRSVKEIASTLNVSPKTVEFHKTRIRKELGVYNTAELTKSAVALGLAFVQ